MDLPADNTQAEESGVTERREEDGTWAYPSTDHADREGGERTGEELPRAGKGGLRDGRTVVEVVVEPCATTCASRKVRAGFGGALALPSVSRPRGRMVRDGSQTRERR